MLPTHHLTPFSRLPLRNSITEPGAKICAILWDPLSSKRGSKETELCENELLCKVSLSDFWPTERPWDTSVVNKQVWLQYWDEVMFLATWWLLQWPNILVLYNKSTDRYRAKRAHPSGVVIFIQLLLSNVFSYVKEKVTMKKPHQNNVD